MRQKFAGKKIRPEFKKLLKEYRTYKRLADLLDTTPANIGVMKNRGYMSAPLAEKAESMTAGKYKARMLAKRGEIY